MWSKCLRTKTEKTKMKKKKQKSKREDKKEEDQTPSTRLRPGRSRNWPKWSILCLWLSLGQILGADPEQCEAGMRVVATLPLVLGGLGFRSAARTSQSAFRANWADAIPVVRARHPEVASQFVRH